MTNIYPYGQCTWWCARECPWTMRYGNLGTALDWAGNWRSHGGFVNAVPAVGTIACFQPGADGADKDSGHVAVVVRLAPGGFIVTEMHAPTLGVEDTRLCPLVPGIAFLYENGPIPPVIIGDPMQLYQQTNGTIWQFVGNSKLQLGSGADAEYLVGLGWKLTYESKITAILAAAYARMPVI